MTKVRKKAKKADIKRLVRIPFDVDKALVSLAAMEDRSINAQIINALRRGVIYPTYQGGPKHNQ